MTIWLVGVGDNSYQTVFAQRFEIEHGYLWFYGIEDDDDAEVACIAPGWQYVRRETEVTP